MSETSAMAKIKGRGRQVTQRPNLCCAHKQQLGGKVLRHVPDPGRKNVSGSICYAFALRISELMMGVDMCFTSSEKVGKCKNP